LQRIPVMAKTNPALATPLRNRLEELAAVEPCDLPMLSLYLNLAADQHGRDSYEAFLRKAVAERRKAFRVHTPERDSFDRDVARIEEYLAGQVDRSVNGLAVFACSARDDLFEVIPLAAGVDEHWLFVGSTPHLYPLARLIDQYPRYVAAVLDTHVARMFVFSLGAIERRSTIISDKTRRSSMGGWSQARYRRHAENWHLLHVKDFVAALDKIVREESINHVVIAGDKVVVPIVKEQLPQHLIDKLVDILRLERTIPEDRLLQETLDVLRQKDAESDEECVADLVDEWQGSGLAVIGPSATLKALTFGQVDELVITASPQQLSAPAAAADEREGAAIHADTSFPSGPPNANALQLAQELIARAGQTGARIRFIENPALLEEFGGAGAFLRFRV
jgi:peptide subunit release factor 1 (eRF1)